MTRLVGTGASLESAFAPGAAPGFWDRAGERFADYLSGEQLALAILSIAAVMLVTSTLRVRAAMRRRRQAALVAAGGREGPDLGSLRRARMGGEGGSVGT